MWVLEEMCKLFLDLIHLLHKLNVALLDLWRTTEKCQKFERVTKITTYIFLNQVFHMYQRILCLVNTGCIYYARNKNQIHLKHWTVGFILEPKLPNPCHFICKWKVWTRLSPRFHLALWFCCNSIILLSTSQSASLTTI